MSASSTSKSGLAKLFGWVRTAITGLLGLLGGAVGMYLSPLVEEAVKPARPIPNFTYHVVGLQVTFENRSVGKEGWWDFGDGSALEPFVPDQKTIVHKYPRPGKYQARLILVNLLGEDAEREVTVEIDKAHEDLPSIDSFQVEPLEPNRFAPATFRLTSQLTNSDLCIWACCKNHRLEVIPDPPMHQERYVTFPKPGTYTIKVAAVQGNHIVEKSQNVTVQPPRKHSVVAIVKVKDQAVRVKSLVHPKAVRISVPPGFREPVYSFREEIFPQQGFWISAAKFARPVNAPFIQNAQVTIAPDGSRAVLSGKFLVSQKMSRYKSHLSPHWVALLHLTQQQNIPVTTTSGDPVVSHLAVPGRTQIPLPSVPKGWFVKDRQLEIMLLEGSRPIWRGSYLPRNTPVVVNNQNCRVTATKVGDRLQVDLVPILYGFWPRGN